MPNGFFRSFAMSFWVRIALLAGLTIPGAAFAASGDDSTAPTPTETTTECKKTEVWDETEKKCIDAQSGALDNDTLFDAAREIAYAGRPDDALVVLEAMTEGDSDRVLTYKGFANRKAGRVAEGMGFYQAALTQNPDNILARSYMGQAFVQQGAFDLAALQLDEIVSRGGAGTWAEASLREAIATGQTFSY
jgi:tetratricopeptide (TPR) repeat protein